MKIRNGHIYFDHDWIECRWIDGADQDAPLLIFLHEGLGCVGLWGDFPQALSAATGCPAFVYSRFGYGGSSAIDLPRPITYMHDEALVVLPRILDALQPRRFILVGHSDGASIAAIYAGGRADPRLAGLCLMAPHTFVEDISIRSIEAARLAYETGDLKHKLSRWHGDVDCAFNGWNGAWLSPGFRSWNLATYVEKITAPTQIIQGEDDAYGTAAQATAFRAAAGPVDIAMLAQCGHSPYREARAATLAAMGGFITKVMQNNS
jgi:pimeloyl-ACP methyl ester carboxylesterase